MINKAQRIGFIAIKSSLLRFLIKGISITFSLLIACNLITLTGCTATHTAIHKRNLDVQTKMSASVFLDPVPSEKKTVFLQIRNTSDRPGLNLESDLANALMAKGYTLVFAPEQAHYLLQA